MFSISFSPFHYGRDYVLKYLENEQKGFAVAVKYFVASQCLIYIAHSMVFFKPDL